MNRIDMESEYSDSFDSLRKNRVKTSYYKYGPAKENFSSGNVKALQTANLCIKKYEETGNTEYLCDAANYLMFEFMYPQRKNAYFRATGSNESAGIVGLSVAEMQRMMEDDRR